MTRDEIGALVNGLSRDAGKWAILMDLSAQVIAAQGDPESAEFVDQLRGESRRALASIDALILLLQAAQAGALTGSATLPMAFQDVTDGGGGWPV